jgi:CheY-like chemotaxis protein
VHGHAKTVLLVADDPILRALWQQLLHVGGGAWAFVHASSGAEAMRASEDRPPQVVISEAVLTDVDVVQLVQGIRRHEPDVAVVIAGDSAASRHELAGGDVALVPRFASGTAELPRLVDLLLGEENDGAVIDLRSHVVTHPGPR